MTVGEMIEALRQLPPEIPIYTWGLGEWREPDLQVDALVSTSDAAFIQPNLGT